MFPATYVHGKSAGFSPFVGKSIQSNASIRLDIPLTHGYLFRLVAICKHGGDIIAVEQLR